MPPSALKPRKPRSSGGSHAAKSSPASARSRSSSNSSSSSSSKHVSATLTATATAVATTAAANNNNNPTALHAKPTATPPNDPLDILSLPPSHHTGELHDFLWVMQDEPHASRRRQLMKEHGPEIQKLMGHEWRTKYIVVVLMAAQIASAVAMRHDALWGGTWRFYAMAYLVGAPIVQALFLAVHEISHNLAFRSFTANKLFAIFANIPMVLPFAIAFKHYHNEHHKFQGVDGVDTDLPTVFEAKWFSSTLGKVFFMSNQMWFYAFRPLVVRQQRPTLWHALNWVVQISFVAGVVHVWGWGPILYLMMSNHFSGGWHPVSAHFIAEHYVFADKVETASYYGALNAITFNVGYHNEHHDFPLVPWSRLAELERIGKYRDTLPHHNSWVRVWWEFLSNPAVTLFNRVKRLPSVTREAASAAGRRSAEVGSADYQEKEWVVG